MKTITITLSDNFEYVIFSKHVVWLSSNKQDGGTFIMLSTGIRVHTMIEIKTLTKMLKGED
ncbi:hypothetical protein [Flavobacterium marginilacus]|uniref:hypothetical protein n=1 Tax=Flavobacterium marginilacus TaxID=3003256 RepID=UPI00248D5594|nr:hypothetical protein [Flavobacterium marginilacus]